MDGIDGHDGRTDHRLPLEVSLVEFPHGDFVASLLDLHAIHKTKLVAVSRGRSVKEENVTRLAEY